jgi:hypothetical protein
MRVCNRLTTLITSEENPTLVTGVQTFGPGGVPVVASASPQARCAKFYE